MFERVKKILASMLSSDVFNLIVNIDIISLGGLGTQIMLNSCINIFSIFAMKKIVYIITSKSETQGSPSFQVPLAKKADILEAQSNTVSLVSCIPLILVKNWHNRIYYPLTSPCHRMVHCCHLKDHGTLQNKVILKWIDKYHVKPVISLDGHFHRSRCFFPVPRRFFSSD